MDLTVCVCCQAFLKNSLENDNHANYCCPYGEIGRLCPLNRSKVCPYCWFARCEIEGLVERWQLCNGDSEKWNEIISGFEYDTDDDDDEDDDEDEDDDDDDNDDNDDGIKIIQEIDKTYQ
jgi:hypothetical protein